MEVRTMLTIKSGKEERNLVTLPMVDDSYMRRWPWPSRTTFSRCSRSLLWMRVRR